MLQSRLYQKLRSPVGWIEIAGVEEVSRWVRQLRDYFRGKRKKFTVTVAPEGTPFQKKVWRALQQIPYGTTVSYGEIAKKIGHPRAVRAVGTACGKNPLPILIPCHRVVATRGGLGGYSSGLWRKKWLLQHENLNSTSQPPRTLFPAGSEDDSLDASNVTKRSKNLSEEPEGNRARRGVR